LRRPEGRRGPVRITTVFNKLLSLQGARVESVKFTPDGIDVTVARRGRLHRCPRCRFSTRAAYDQHLGTWRHIALGKWRVTICSTVSRLSCPIHGVLTEAVGWAAPGSRFTLDFEDLVAWLAREMNRTAVTRLVRVTWRAIGGIIARVVERKLDQRRLDELYEIGLDEVSYRKGHKYLSVVADHRRGDPVWLGEGRSQKTIGTFFDELGPERSKKLTVVTMDMCAPFIAEVKERAKNAEIAFDPFHVVKLGNEAVHQLRRTEARERKGTTEADVLKGSRWALLKAPESLEIEEHLRLCEVARINQRVYRGYLLKEELRMLYRCSPGTAPTHLASWLAWASRSKLPPFVKLARTLRKYTAGVLAAIRLGLSNGRLEGINNKIGVLKHRAYGFHSAAALIAMVYLCCTRLHVELPT
jgi:transposase